MKNGNVIFEKAQKAIAKAKAELLKFEGAATEDFVNALKGVEDAENAIKSILSAEIVNDTVMVKLHPDDFLNIEDGAQFNDPIARASMRVLGGFEAIQTNGFITINFHDDSREMYSFHLKGVDWFNYLNLSREEMFNKTLSKGQTFEPIGEIELRKINFAETAK